MIKFRLSDETKKMLNTQNKRRSKCRIDVNSPKFYEKHPDLMPRNVYLATGRILSKEKIDKYVDKHFKLSLKEKCQILFNRLKNFITGCNK